MILGEILVPTGEIALPGSKGRYLKCLDARGDTILLGMEQRGKFSALAREDNISGVHTAKNLLSKRLPLTVRLVHGTAPRGLKSPSHFVPELRLLCSGPRTREQLRGMTEFSQLVEKCTELATEVADRMQVLDGKLGESKKQTPAQDLKNGRDENRIPAYSKDYDEIDQIYDYVRGFAPLPKNINSTPSHPVSDLTKPEPPPIETIPTKKLKAEKRNRKSTSSTIREKPPESAHPYGEDSPGLPKFNLQQAMELDGTLDSSNSGGRASGDSGGQKQPEKRSRKLSRPRSLTNLGGRSGAS
ncbi:hypothetical protein NQ318_012642 [Aromia moschata]|uniref:CABIT domain-containing protein n=1 Tax=Aromia moschata TaxID=1265417 RepID=A0AAV8XP26_9CUCU|nr:hypothetical protein NQ318_012642 [Aromia moschata]